MLNQELYKKISFASLSEGIDEAVKTMEQSSNKLVLLLRDKTDAETCKAITKYAKEKKIQIINLGLQLSKYLLENDKDSINEYLTRNMKTYNEMIVDNAEILFDPEIKMKAFSLFKNLARHQALVVVLDGCITKDEKYIYGSSTNKDYSQYEELTDTYILDLTGGLE